MAFPSSSAQLYFIKYRSKSKFFVPLPYTRSQTNRSSDVHERWWNGDDDENDDYNDHAGESYLDISSK